MQNYIEALVQHADKTQKAAETACAEARAELKTLSDYRPAVIASILDVPVSEISKQNSYYTAVKRWPGVLLSVSGHTKWKRHRDNERKAVETIDACCKAELAARQLKEVKTLQKYRAFVRARYGRMPTEKPAVVIAAFLESLKPVACKK